MAIDTSVLSKITSSWMEIIKKAEKHKAHEFGEDAKEAMRFFDGPHDFMYESKFAKDSQAFGFRGSGDLPQTTFRMTSNKVAEMVQLFGPALYHKNPHRQVTPRVRPPAPLELMAPGDPNDFFVQAQRQMVQQTGVMTEQHRQILADLLSHYLNYTPNELDLRGNLRMAIDEAIIKGMGVVWHETYHPAGSPYKMVGSFYDTVDNLLLDPDMTQPHQALWCSRRRVHPTWMVEQMFELPRGSVKGNLESTSAQGQVEAMAQGEYWRARGETNDLLVWFEVYSRMGVGLRMKSGGGFIRDGMDEMFDNFGPYSYLAVCDTVNWPLNLPAPVMEETYRKMGQSAPDYWWEALQWPTPFWADPADPWPFTHIAFHRRPGKLWPMSHLKPALGELKAMNWLLSFMVDKVKNTSRDFVAILESASEEIKDAIEHGGDLTILPLKGSDNKSINEVVQFLQHPDFKRDAYEMLAILKAEFERRTGTNDLMYGYSAKQFRSSAEAQIKSQNTEIRPGDMADQVEAAVTAGSRKEALMARWHLTGQDVQPQLGPEFAALWDEHVANSEIYSVVHELDYRIEAGSIRKPNRQRDQENFHNASQVWGPVFKDYAFATGDFGPLSALAMGWAKANDMDPNKFVMKPPPPPDPSQNPEQQKLAMEQQKIFLERQKAEIEMQLKQHDMALKQESHEQEIRHEEESHDQEMRHTDEELEAKLRLMSAQQRTRNGKD